MPIFRYEIDPVAERSRWLDLRRHDVTASAASALLGDHPYQTAYGLYLEKTGQLVDEPGSGVLERGLMLEPVAVKRLQQLHPGWVISEPKTYYRDGEWRLGATPDLIGASPEGGLVVWQIKSVEPAAFKRNWLDEDGEIEPPLYAAVQALVEADLTGANEARLAVLVVGHTIQLHEVPVPRVPELLDAVRAATREFWRRVEAGDPPDPDYGKDAGRIAALHREARIGKVIELSGNNRVPALLARRAQLAAAKSAIDAEQNAIKAELLSVIGDAEAAILSDGSTVTAKTITRKAYSVEASSYRDIRHKQK